MNQVLKLLNITNDSDKKEVGKQKISCLFKI